MNKRRFYNSAAFIGSYATGTKHQMFDTCYLHACSMLFNRVDCYKDESTFDFIKEMEEKYNFGGNISLHRIRVISEDSKLRVILYNINSAFINIRLLLKLKHDYIIFAFNNPFSLHIINTLNKFLKKNVIICAHGEMEMLIEEPSSLWSKFNKAILNDFFFNRVIQENIYFTVLGDSIYKNVKSLLPATNSKKFFPLEVPCYMPKLNDLCLPPSGKIRFGLLGTLSPLKGMNDFIDFVKKIKRGIKYDYSISIIGRINSHQYDEFLAENDIDVTWSFLSREEFETRISKIDCVLFFYPSTSYKLIASGTILDAISRNKPILGIKNDFFNYIVKESNCPALLVDSVDDLIESIKAGEVHKLLSSQNIVNKKMFEPEAIARKFHILIEQINDNYQNSI